MGKRRNASKKTYAGNNCGGSKDDKYSAFEFAEDDLRVEVESRKTLAKFGTKSPSKHHRQSVYDNYVFLECYAQGATSQKDTGNDMLDADDTDSVFQHTSGTDVMMSLGSLNYDSRKPGCHTAGKKHNKILHVDPGEDGRMQLRSLSSSLNLAENEGLLEEQSTEFDADSNDCEAVVVVAPYYVKYGKHYYTRCRLTFSQSCIRLEGSPVGDETTTHCLKWSTFDILNIEYQQCESVKAEVVNLQMKSKDTNVDETGNGSSGRNELEFVVLDDPQWTEKQEEIKSLDLKYKAAWKTNVCDIFEESFDNMVYPNGDPDAVFISRRDIELLQPRTFINDTIIDFYIKYLLNKAKPEEKHRFHFFNTFFFRKLAAVCQDSSRASEGRDVFQGVRKWTRNVNIFERDYIFLPVNFSLHWSLIIICHPGEVANIKDKVLDESSNVPCILHMDSIRGSHGGLENLIRSYLWEEWKERGHTHEEDINMKFLNMEFVSLQLPQQENLFDCGLFLLHYVELFLEQVSNFSKTKYVDILNKGWFLPAEVSLKKRDHIRKLIYRIVEDNALQDPQAASDDKNLQNEGDGDANSAQKESCSVVKLKSSGDVYIKVQHCSVPMIEQRSIDKSAGGECFEPCKVPILYQFNNLSLPMKEENACGQGDITGSLHTSEFRTGGVEDPIDGDCCSKKSIIVIDVQNEQECCPLLGVCSILSEEDLAACVVEDSEDESSHHLDGSVRS